MSEGEYRITLNAMEGLCEKESIVEKKKNDVKEQEEEKKKKQAASKLLGKVKL